MVVGGGMLVDGAGVLVGGVVVVGGGAVVHGTGVLEGGVRVVGGGRVEHVHGGGVDGNGGGGGVGRWKSTAPVASTTAK